jgi:heterodisulfide reductase subunit A
MENKRIGVYICWCGTNIALMVDVEEVTRQMAKVPDVVIARDYKYMCSDPGQDLIIKDVKENNLNRVVVASCSPRMHELTFRKALKKAGLNPYYFEMANIREQNSWVHTDRHEATKKAEALVLAAINRVRHHEALDSRKVEIDPATLVIGGGITGISAALEIAGSGEKVYLIEQSEKLGGHAAGLDLTFPYMYSATQMLKPMLLKVTSDPNIKIFLNSHVDEIKGYIGNFEAQITSENGLETKIRFGNIIVATGLKTFDPSGIENYGYGKFPDVITSTEFEKMLQEGLIQKKNGTEPENIAIIHCVGSRNKKYHEYCSRICCSTALKFANQARSQLPKANIFELYADMRAFGKGCEELYTFTSRRNIKFLMFDQENELPNIMKAEKSDNCDMLIELNEKLSGKTVLVPADLIVLMVGLEARADVKHVAHSTGLSICGNEFYIEKHPKLDPVATTTNGVFIAGACQAPKDIPESVSQAKAAAARILSTIARGSVEVEATTSCVNEEICCSCQTCIRICPYSAISFLEDKRVSFVNEILCKGCGTCGSGCPTGAIKCKHFTDTQIFSEIEGLLHMSYSMEEIKEV